LDRSQGDDRVVQTEGREAFHQAACAWSDESLAEGAVGMKLNEYIDQGVLTDPEWRAAYEPSQLRRETARMLARARLEQRLSQAELAERCQTDQAVISRIERGVVSPSLDTLSRLAKGLGLRPVLYFERATDASQSTKRTPRRGMAAKESAAQRGSRSAGRTSVAGSMAVVSEDSAEEGRPSTRASSKRAPATQVGQGSARPKSGGHSPGHAAVTACDGLWVAGTVHASDQNRAFARYD
jgi:transcriptional regulator with XRE-family HTH domain